MVRMMHPPAGFTRSLVAALAAIVLAQAVAARATAAEPETGPAAALRSRYAALSGRMEHSTFQQHLYLESAEDPHSLQGDIWAVVNHPMAAVTGTVTSPAHWCDALILHLNVKYCHPAAYGTETALSVAIGRKYDQPLSEAFRLDFAFGVSAVRPEYVSVELNAAKGPLGTTSYRITLEAVALDAERVFLHLRYSYDYGFQARLATEAYLATGGKGKIGFTRVDGPGEREARFIGGVRGAVERNTMRYYLAIDAYLGSLAAPASQRFEQSLERWYSATERYARQLHELDRDSYLAMKRREYLRQQSAL
jgi:hypothetical protein